MKEYIMNDKLYRIRPHHGMCLCFFRGKGYSNGFVKHMADIKTGLCTHAMVCLTGDTDDICANCPNNISEHCKSEEKVLRYDRKVLRLCNLSVGEIIPYASFEALIHTNILRKGLRENICSDCQWNELCHFEV